MVQPQDTILVRLPNGARVRVEAEQIGLEREVTSLEQRFEQISDAIEGIAESLTESLRRIRPDGAEVEIGLNVAVEAGQLTALLVKGTATANLKVTLSWDFARAPALTPPAAAASGTPDAPKVPDEPGRQRQPT